MYRVIDHILNLCLTVGSYLIPKKQNTYLCGGQAGKLYNGNTKHFYLHCNKKSKDTCWITRNHSIINELDFIKLPCKMLYTLDGFFRILRSEYLIINSYVKDVTYSDVLFGRFNIVRAGDECPLNKQGINSITKQTNVPLLQQLSNWLQIIQYQKYYLLLATSEETSFQLKQSFCNNNVIITGTPNNEVFFEEDVEEPGQITQLELHRYDRVILYAPEYRNYLFDPFNSQFSTQLNEYLIRTNSVMVIKQHHLQELLIPGTYTNIKYYSLLSDYGKRVRVNTTHEIISSQKEPYTDTHDLLRYTDLLITDYTTLIYDYVLLNKPYILYLYGEELYKGVYHLGGDLFKGVPGPYATNEDQLLELITDTVNWFNSHKHRREYKIFKNKYHKFQQRGACERLIKYLELNGG